MKIPTCFGHDRIQVEAHACPCRRHS